MSWYFAWCGKCEVLGSFHTKSYPSLVRRCIFFTADLFFPVSQIRPLITDTLVRLTLKEHGSLTATHVPEGCRPCTCFSPVAEGPDLLQNPILRIPQNSPFLNFSICKNMFFIPLGSWRYIWCPLWTRPNGSRYGHDMLLFKYLGHLLIFFWNLFLFLLGKFPFGINNSLALWAGCGRVKSHRRYGLTNAIRVNGFPDCRRYGIQVGNSCLHCCWKNTVDGKWAAAPCKLRAIQLSRKPLTSCFSAPCWFPKTGKLLGA